MNGLLIPGTNSNGSITSNGSSAPPPPPPIPTQLFSNLNINNNETTTVSHQSGPPPPPPLPLIGANNGFLEQSKNLKPTQRYNEDGCNNSTTSQKQPANGTINGNGGGGLDFLTEIRQRIQKKNFQQQQENAVDQQPLNDNNNFRQEDSDGSYKPSNIKKLNSNIPQKNDSPKPLKKFVFYFGLI